MPDHTSAPSITGKWYLGVPCSSCDEMVLYATDLSQGHGILGFYDAHEWVQERCVKGHLMGFYLDDLRRFRWLPRQPFQSPALPALQLPGRRSGFRNRFG